MRRRGFTIIELLVVISIIAILASILLPTFNKVRKVAQCGAVQGTIRALEQALRAYHDDNTLYPVEDKSDVPTTGFLFQLQTLGLNSPYVRDLKMQDVEPSTIPLAANAKVKDSWYQAARKNHIHYRRGPLRTEGGVTSEAGYKAALANFYGNDATFNLWSFGPNRVDDSSDQAETGTFTRAATGGSGGDEGTDPNAVDGIKDDLTNWNSNSSSASKR